MTITSSTSVKPAWPRRPRKREAGAVMQSVTVLDCRLLPACAGPAGQDTPVAEKVAVLLPGPVSVQVAVASATIAAGVMT